MVNSSVIQICNIYKHIECYINRRLIEEGLHDLACSHGIILLSLIRKSPQTMSELSCITGKKPQTVTTLVSKLEKLGYVFTVQDLVDKRIRRVHTTEKINELTPIFDNISKKVLEKIYDNTSEEDRKIINQALDILNTNTKKLI